MIIHCNSRSEWLERRKEFIGASEISAAMGINPWVSRYRLWQLKSGVDEQAESIRMRVGQRLEDELLQWWQDNRPHKAYRRTQFILFVDEEHKLAATPDALGDDGKILIECKTAERGAKGWGEPGTDQIPPYYLVQVAAQVHCLRKNGFSPERVELPVLFGLGTVELYAVPVDAHLVELGEKCAEEALAFWRLVEAGVPPEAFGQEAVALAQEKYRLAQIGTIREANEEEEELIRKLIDSQEKLKAAEEEVATIKARIMERMGTAEVLRSSLGTITWKNTKEQVKTDWEKVARALNPPDELIARYTEIRPGTRRFLGPK